MQEPFIWNTLTESVDWLNKNQAEQFTPKLLIQKILDKAQTAGTPYPPTIIKTLLPRGMPLASLLLFPKESDMGEFEMRRNERMIKAYGEPFSKGSMYTGYISADAIPLLPAGIADLIIRGDVEISLIHENQLRGHKFRSSEFGFVMPSGAIHVATIENCGINRNDLKELLEQLNKPKNPMSSTSDVNYSDVGMVSAGESYPAGKDIKPDEPWITFCKSQIDDIFQSRVANGRECGVGFIADELVGRCKREKFVTKRHKQV